MVTRYNRLTHFTPVFPASCNSKLEGPLNIHHPGAMHSAISSEPRNRGMSFRSTDKSLQVHDQVAQTQVCRLANFDEVITDKGSYIYA